MKIEQIAAAHDLVLARAAQEEPLHDWDNMPKRLVINGETFNLIVNQSDHFKKHYSTSNNYGTLDFRWYKVERGNFVASVVTRLRSDATAGFVNKTFDIELKRDGTKANDIAREIEDALKRYPGSRATARIGLDPSLSTMDNPPRSLKLLGHTLKLLKDVGPQLAAYQSSDSLIYACSAMSAVGVVLWRDRQDSYAHSGELHHFSRICAGQHANVTVQRA